MCYFYSNRLNNLWINEVDEGVTGGYYEGRYGDGVGAGKYIKITSRDYYSELYLWRLPISDCYLIKNFPKNIPTMGYELDRCDIEKIQYLCENCPTYMWNNIFTKIPNLIKIYDLYNMAINDCPTPPNKNNFGEFKTYEEFKFNYNTTAITNLRNM